MASSRSVHGALPRLESSPRQPRPAWSHGGSNALTRRVHAAPAKGAAAALRGDNLQYRMHLADGLRRAGVTNLP
jgi:hypothetical protein